MPKPSPGWIKLYRKITECEIWKDDDPFSKRDAWIDILLQCNYEDKKTVIGKKIMTIESGSFLTSQDHLAVRWHWGRQKVRTYLKLLEELEMITSKTTSKYTIIKVPNYQGYQGFSNDFFAENNQVNNQPIIQQATNKNGTFLQKNEKNQPSKKPTENPIGMGKTECFEGVDNQANNQPIIQQIIQQATTTKEYKEYKEVKEDILLPPHNTKYISNRGAGGGEFNLFLAVENALKLPMTRDLADKFIALLNEVGEGALKEALDESVKYNGRSYAYVEAVARRIASGDSGRAKNAGAIDWDEVKRMVEKETENADNK